MKKIFFILIIPLLLSGCLVKNKDYEIKAEIEAAKYCQEKSDCIQIASKCPFGCYNFVNKSEAVRIQGLIDDYASTCIYGCVELLDYDCIDNKCQEITERYNQDYTESTVGNTCDSSDECLVPFNYAIQSNCPYQAYCDQGSCVVGCPDWQHSPNPGQSISYQVLCKEDSDCECDTNRKDFVRCSCLDEQCVVVVEE